MDPLHFYIKTRKVKTRPQHTICLLPENSEGENLSDDDEYPTRASRDPLFIPESEDEEEDEEDEEKNEPEAEDIEILSNFIEEEVEVLGVELTSTEQGPSTSTKRRKVKLVWSDEDVLMRQDSRVFTPTTRKRGRPVNQDVEAIKKGKRRRRIELPSTEIAGDDFNHWPARKTDRHAVKCKDAHKNHK
ncbi:unnamed protein product [Parnassius apollo]|uniref:(apollo) hypothetical protein n=1 Tax=Parnassius apollo TaxID=110799 RepID=A0A8S3WLQ5_PARAO|nr:unnamed protein product [Parnassius apollo]